MGNLGMPELIVVLLIALVLFGANRLPEIGRSIGRSIQEFKKGIAGLSEEAKTPESPKETKTEIRQG